MTAVVRHVKHGKNVPLTLTDHSCANQLCRKTSPLRERVVFHTGDKDFHRSVDDLIHHVAKVARPEDPAVFIGGEFGHNADERVERERGHF